MAIYSLFIMLAWPNVDSLLQLTMMKLRARQDVKVNAVGREQSLPSSQQRGKSQWHWERKKRGIERDKAVEKEVETDTVILYRVWIFCHVIAVHGCFAVSRAVCSCDSMARRWCSELRFVSPLTSFRRFCFVMFYHLIWHLQYSTKNIRHRH